MANARPPPELQSEGMIVHCIYMYVCMMYLYLYVQCHIHNYTCTCIYVYIYTYVTVCGKTNLIPQTLILQYRAKGGCNRYLVDFEFIP